MFPSSSKSTTVFWSTDWDRPVVPNSRRVPGTPASDSKWLGGVSVRFLSQSLDRRFTTYTQEHHHNDGHRRWCSAETDRLPRNSVAAHRATIAAAVRRGHRCACPFVTVMRRLPSCHGRDATGTHQDQRGDHHKQRESCGAVPQRLRLEACEDRLTHGNREQQHGPCQQRFVV